MTKRLTTTAGAPVPDDQNSLTAGPRGPVLLQDFHLLEKMAHFNRERIPERVVHAKGTGAVRYVRASRTTSRSTPRRSSSARSASTTDVFVRFSTVGGEKGSADTERDPRGFAIKFYTEDGNWDLVGNNTPVFFIRDPKKFADFIHTQKRDPRTNCKSPDDDVGLLVAQPGVAPPGDDPHERPRHPASYRQHERVRAATPIAWSTTNGEQSG